jgi:hypothetical protein
VATATDLRDLRDAAYLQPRSRWRQLRGDHAGAVVEVLSFTKGGRVKYHTLPGEGAANGNGHFDLSSKWTKPKDWFLSSYTLAMPAPVSQVPLAIEKPPPVLQPAFRQTPKPKAPKPKPTPAPPVVVGIMETRSAEFNVSLESISPDRAKDWLSRGGLNRHLNLNRVEGLAAAIMRGEWQITGDTIKLDKTGRVRDGQHRLAAIAEGHTTVQALVVFGVDEAAFDVMDTGRSRTISDIIGMHGIPNRTATASASRSLILWGERKRLVAHARESATVVTSASTIKFLREHPDLIESLHMADLVRHEFPGGQGLWGALLYLFRQISESHTQAFVDGMMTGAGLQAGHPILVLRNRLLSHRDYWGIQNNSDKEALAASVIKAWNGFRRNETFDTGWRALHWRNIGRSAEPFPVPE